MLDTVQTADAALVRACQAGDKAPFCRLVERHYTLACAVAFAATGSAEAARDVAQEAFVTAWRELAKLRDPARFRSWLCGIVRNTARYQRRHGRRHAPEARESLAAIDGAVQAPSIHDELEQRERVRLVEDALAQLPASYREPLVLFYWGGQSVEQVAAELELAEQTVRQRLCRGRRQLERRVRDVVEDALVGARPQREGVAVAVIAAIVAAEREAAAAAAGATGGWIGAGLVEALIGVAALGAVLIVSAVDPPPPPSPLTVAVPVIEEASPAARVIAAAEPRARAAPDAPTVEVSRPSAVEARRAPLRSRPRGVVSHGRIEVQHVVAPQLVRVELPLIEAVVAPPPRVPRPFEIAPPALDLMRDLVDL